MVYPHRVEKIIKGHTCGGFYSVAEIIFAVAEMSRGVFESQPFGIMLFNVVHYSYSADVILMWHYCNKKQSKKLSVNVKIIPCCGSAAWQLFHSVALQQAKSLYVRIHRHRFILAAPSCRRLSVMLFEGSGEIFHIGKTG